jgi:hypothetical protein
MIVKKLEYHLRDNGVRTIVFLFILIYFVLIFIVLEIAVTLLIISGLEKEVARFQAVSMLTATGFTTQESELIARHPIRRKIAISLILFGVFSLAVMIASISTILTKDLRIVQLIIITCFFGIGLFVVKTKSFISKMSGEFHHKLKKEYELHEMPFQEILYLSEGDLFTSVQIDEESPYVNKKMDEVFTEDKDILLLFVRRGQEKIRRERMKLVIQAKDELFVYGSNAVIDKQFHVEIANAMVKKQDEEEIKALNNNL